MTKATAKKLTGNSTVTEVVSRIEEYKAEDTSNKLSQARKEVANSLVRGYGAMREYAQLLNATFAFNWFEVEHSDQSDEAKPILAEKKEFYKELREAMHTNPSVVWARVCSFGKVERFGEPEKAEGEQGEGESEQGESATSTNRSPMLRNIEELTTLWKFNSKQENLDPKIVEAQKDITSALSKLGVNISML